MQLKEYKENKIGEALVAAFVEFDRSLITDTTMAELKRLAKRPESPVPSRVLRLAKGQAVEDDDDEDNDEDGDSAPVDFG